MPEGSDGRECGPGRFENKLKIPDIARKFTDLGFNMEYLAIFFVFFILFCFDKQKHCVKSLIRKRSQGKGLKPNLQYYLSIHLV